MDGEKLWKAIWSLLAVGLGILAIKAAASKPADLTFFAIWTFSGMAAKVLAEYGYDWFDL